jgi:hypothetical protein
MFEPAVNFTVIARLRACRHPAASHRVNRIGDTMSTTTTSTASPARRRRSGRIAIAAITFIATIMLAVVPLVGFSTTVAHACACGCSVFDVGGLGAPQEQDHGGRVFFEFWSGDQNQNWVGTSRAPAAINMDKQVNTQWYNVGFEYSFNRQWGVMVRAPYVNRAFTTETDFSFPGEIQTFRASDLGDIEVMGMYTGFFNDMSTGVIFGVKLPSGTYTAPGFDRDTQIGSGSTDLILGGFHRGLITGDNAWQYFYQATWRQPFLYRDAADPQGFFDGNPGVVQSYHPGLQVDGAAGIIYNNWYNVLGFDKITPLAQVIISHRNADSGTGSDPFNSGFDRVMLSPGIEFTKVLDEANNRVLKTYFDIEVPVYYRTNAANNAGTEGQLIAPYLIKLVTSYNF